jgi:diacylglycerol kinase (ATP)
VTGSFHLIVNPAAGGGRAVHSAAEAAGVLAALGLRHQVTRSASLAHARELAAAAVDAGHVAVAVGGDGMAGALAAAVAGQGGDGVLGLIPAGRGNDLARVLAIPAGPEAAVTLLAGGTPRRIDLIGVRVGDRPEVTVAGSVYAGLPAVAGDIANATRWLPGPAVYPLAALRALGGWSPVTFRLGGIPTRPAEFPGYAVVIANIAYFGAGMMAAPPARPDDGELDIVTMRHGSRLAFLRVLLRIRAGTHVALPQVGLDRAAAVTLTMDRALPVAADGEVLPGAAPLPAGTPLAVRVLPGALRVLAPAEGLS